MKKLLYLGIAFLLMAGVSSGQTIKIGIVDMQKALNESKEGVDAKKDISKKAEKLQSDLKNLQQDLDKMKAEIEKQGSFLSEDAKIEKEKIFQKKLKEFQSTYKDAQDELQQKDAEMTRKIVQKLEKILAKIGTDDKYTLILEKSAGGIFFYDKATDITELLIKKSNEDNGKK